MCAVVSGSFIWARLIVMQFMCVLVAAKIIRSATDCSNLIKLYLVTCAFWEAIPNQCVDIVHSPALSVWCWQGEIIVVVELKYRKRDFLVCAHWQWDVFTEESTVHTHLDQWRNAWHIETLEFSRRSWLTAWNDFLTWFGGDGLFVCTLAVVMRVSFLCQGTPRVYKSV